MKTHLKKNIILFMIDKPYFGGKMSIEDFLDNCPTIVRICDGSKPAFEGDICEKQNIYFGCNYNNIPTVVIEWSEKGRGFGEYTFQIIDGKMVCNNECDSKETVKRILCKMVDQCTFLEELESNKEIISESKN